MIIPIKGINRTVVILSVFSSLITIFFTSSFLQDIRILKNKSEYVKKRFVIKDHSIESSGFYHHYLIGLVDNLPTSVKVGSIPDKGYVKDSTKSFEYYSVDNTFVAFHEAYPIDSTFFVWYNPSMNRKNDLIDLNSLQTIEYNEKSFDYMERNVKNYYIYNLLPTILLWMLFLVLKFKVKPRLTHENK